MSKIPVLLVLAAVLAAGAGHAADKPKTAQTSCFYVTQWEGWKAPDENTLYLGVNMHDVYKVELSAGSPQLLWPSAHLVSIVRGGGSICSPLDLDLKVSDTAGFPVPLIAKSMVKLTPEQVAAIPKKFRPN